jgi:hypothetical protein
MTKQLNDRLQKEGVKTHKERVEELNKYLSKLSEHHDMYALRFFIVIVRSMIVRSILILCVFIRPKIGPG